MHHNGLGVKKKSITIEQKINAIKEYEEERSKAVKGAGVMIANKYNITSSQLSKWYKDKDKYLTTEKAGKKFKNHAGPAIKELDIDNHVSDFVKKRRELNQRVTPRVVAVSVKRQFGTELQNLSIEQVRRKTYRIMHRNGFSKRRVTHQQVLLDEEQLGILKLDFVESLREARNRYGTPNSLIINMDETPVYYDPEATDTWTMRGEKKVAVKSTKTTSKCSALLAVSLAGHKLTPFVVFIAKALNGKVFKETKDYDPRMKYGVGPKGFCDIRIMIEWINQCLKPYVIAHGGGPGSGTL
jgi:hypothetical protein